MSGAAISTKAIPDKWAKPILDTTIIPAHAQATCTVESMTCELGSVAGVTDNAIFDPTPPIDGTPAPGASTLNISPVRNTRTITLDATFTGLAATVAPECTQAVTLLASEDSGPDFDLGSGTNQTIIPVNGVASFTNITAIIGSVFDGSATIDIRFQTAGLPDCVIDVVFQEGPG